MKKGMTVLLDSGISYILDDSVSYAGDKYFAATNVDEADDNLYFFKLIKTGGDDSLELIDQNDNEKVINALIQHMQNTF